MPRQEIRRLRNRTLSGLDSLRIGQQVRERSASLSMTGVPPGQGTVRTPCTPTLSTAKDAITNFVEFNPSGKYFIDYLILRLFLCHISWESNKEKA